MKTKFFLVACMAAFAMCVSCASDDDDSASNSGSVYYDPTTGRYEKIDGLGGESNTADVADGSPSAEAGDVDGSGEPGDVVGSNDRLSNRLTAGEWNDLDNWKFWTSLLNENKFYDKVDYWKFTPKSLVAVKVVDADSNAIANVPVQLMGGADVEYAAKTDNNGLAYCWIGLFNDGGADLEPDNYTLRINGTASEQPVKFTVRKDTALNINVIVNKEIKKPEAKADIAFIVDATGSMGDEIDFLKSDLDYIIDHANTGKVTLRTAALFYRDEDDDYLTIHNDFADDVAVTQKFVSQQFASGGGDYPEAVHTALETALQKLSWSESARARIAFLILDAPAHHNEQVIASLQKSIALYAKNGIKIIPVAASGVDKDTEFMSRFFALATGGTYVFLTDHSGIGNSHIEASVGDYEVEHLADLLVRLIRKYTE